MMKIELSDPDALRAFQEEMADLEHDVEQAIIDEEEEQREAATIDDPSDPRIEDVSTDAYDSGFYS